MAQYTTLSKTEVQEIANTYSLGKVLFFKLLSGGSENTNYCVKTENDKFVFTICEQKTPQEAEELAYLLMHLGIHNFTTSKIIQTREGRNLSIWKGKPILVKSYLEGKILENFSPQLLQYLGTELAQLHKIPAPDYLPKIINYGMEYFDEVKVYAPNSTFYQWLQEIKAYIQQFLSDELPKALIHSDIFYSNVIVAEDEKSAVIMDFEEATDYYRVFDIGMMIVGLCTENRTVNFEKANNIIEGYQTKNSLSELEFKALPAATVYAAAATAFWRHRQFNHVFPDVEQMNRYEEMRDVAEFVCLAEWDI
ncbi:MAG: homoserine kinase type II [Saprospiraceae bacterium]|jgi:homoserine kinase type II